MKRVHEPEATVILLIIGVLELMAVSGFVWGLVQLWKAARH
jgi:hypothetical protein